MKLTDGQLLAVGLILSSIYFILDIFNTNSQFLNLVGLTGLILTLVVEALFLIERIR